MNAMETVIMFFLHGVRNKSIHFLLEKKFLFQLYPGTGYYPGVIFLLESNEHHELKGETQVPRWEEKDQCLFLQVDNNFPYSEKDIVNIILGMEKLGWKTVLGH